MTQLSLAILSEYNFQILVDASGSMAEPWNGKTRWEEAGVIAKSVADFVAPVDDDGIDVLCFGGRFNPETDVYRHVSSDKVYEIFAQRMPSGSTPLKEALEKATEMHFAGSKKSFIVIVTDGLPNDKEGVIGVIVGASKRIQHDSELTYLFLQIGEDPQATEFLRTLDDDLKQYGVMFDIVDKKVQAEWLDKPFEQLFMEAREG